MVSNAARMLSGLFVSLLFFFGLVPSANASNPVVCQTADLSGMSDAARTSEIASKINDVSCDVVELVGSATVTLPTTITIDGVALGAARDVTIREADGTEIVFDASVAATAFELAGTMDVLRLEGLEFRAATESAIFSGNTTGNEIHLTDTLFEANLSSGNGGAIDTIGKVFLHGSNTFRSNVAQGGAGGAILAVEGVFGFGAGNMVVLDSNDAQGGGGGGFYAPNGPVELESLQALDNSANGLSGGAVFGDSITINGHSELTRNTATGNGGALFSIQDTSVDTVTALDNSSSSAGGTFFSVGNFTATGIQMVTGSRANGGSGGYLMAVGFISLPSIQGIDTYASNSGGLLYSVKSVTVSGAVLSTNSRTDADGGVIAAVESISLGSLNATTSVAAGSGGAVTSYTGSLTVTGDVSIANASAGFSGGALDLNQNVTIGGNYTSNATSAVGSGGSIYSVAGAVTISGETSITNSTAGGSGGAIGASNSVNLAAATFTSVTADGSGGCIHITAGGFTATSSVVFDSCEATFGDGGAIFSGFDLIMTDASFLSPVSGNNGGAIMTIFGDVTFSGDAIFQSPRAQAGNGGAINAGGNTTARNLSIISPQAGGDGGAMFSPLGNINVSETLTVTNAISGGAGGVANIGGNTTLNRVVVSNASAANIGGAFFSPIGSFIATGDLSITGASANSSGGALNIGGNITLSGETVEFSGNSSQGDGGAIFSPIGNLQITGTATFDLNSATNTGGALSIGGSIALAAADFTNNSSSGDGGAIFNPVGALTATGNLLFDRNSAAGNGGAIALGGNITLTTATFSNNSATFDGGAMFLPVSQVTSSGLVQFIDNSSGANGGALSGSMDLQQALFRGNSATLDGGAVRGSILQVGPGSRFTANSASNGGALASLGSFAMDGVGFDANIATVSGGAIYAPGSTVELVNSSLYQNTAADGGAIYAGDVIAFGSYLGENSATDAAAVGGGGVVAFGRFESALSTFQDNTSAADGPEIKAGDFFAVGNIIDSASPNPIVAGIYEDEGANFFTGMTDLSFDSALFGRDAELGLQAATLDTSFGQGLYVPGISSTSAARDSVTTQMLQSTSTNQLYSQDFRDLFAGLLSDPQLTLDMLGNARAGQAIDAGAIEYQLLPQLAISRAELLADGMTLELETNLPLAAALEPETFEVFADGASVEFMAGDIATGDTVITITLAAPQEQSAVVTIDYAGSDIVSETEPFNTIGALSQQAVVNSSQYVTPVAAGGYSGPIVYLPSSLGTLYPGQEVTLFGQNLSLVQKINIGGHDAKVIVLSDTSLMITVPELAAGEYNLEVVSSFGFLKVQPSVFVADGSFGVQGLQVIIKRISDTQAKIWAKNPIDAGKIQFKLNDREVAWIRAIDTEDPKLRRVNDLYYLVRTIELKPGKNALEVFVDGERVRRVSYQG